MIWDSAHTTPLHYMGLVVQIFVQVHKHVPLSYCAVTDFGRFGIALSGNVKGIRAKATLVPDVHYLNCII